VIVLKCNVNTFNHKHGRHPEVARFKIKVTLLRFRVRSVNRLFSFHYCSLTIQQNQ